jgi:hypothetical protein
MLVAFTQYIVVLYTVYLDSICESIERPVATNAHVGIKHMLVRVMSHAGLTACVITAMGNLTDTGYDSVAVAEKVSALLDRTNGFLGCRTGRLAYGVQEHRKPPTQLQWADKPLSAEYDPSIQELFAGVSLKHGDEYYLLVSKLDVKISHQPVVQYTDEWYRQERIKEMVYRFRELYVSKATKKATDIPPNNERRHGRATDYPQKKMRRGTCGPISVEDLLFQLKELS